MSRICILNQFQSLQSLQWGSQFTVIYQSPLILTELFKHNLINVIYLTAFHLYQVMMTLHFWMTSLMQASHCPELDTRWPHEYGILNFARRWPRTWSPANQQPKQLRCLQKVTRWQPNHTRRQHEDVIFYQVTYPQDTRRLHDSYTTSYWEYDAFELGHECVTWSPDGINPL